MRRIAWGSTWANLQWVFWFGPCEDESVLHCGRHGGCGWHDLWPWLCGTGWDGPGSEDGSHAVPTPGVRRTWGGRSGLAMLETWEDQLQEILGEDVCDSTCGVLVSLDGWVFRGFCPSCFVRIGYDSTMMWFHVVSLLLSFSSTQEPSDRYFISSSRSIFCADCRVDMGPVYTVVQGCF